MGEWFAKIDALVGYGSAGSWIASALVSILLGFGIRYALQIPIQYLNKRSLKSKSRWESWTADLLAQTKASVLAIWIFSFFFPELTGSQHAERSAHLVFVIATAIQVVLWGVRAVGDWRRDYLSGHAEPSSVAAIALIARLLQAVVIVIVALTALRHLNIDVSAMIAGLSVGSVAIALAAQNIVGDLLAALAIILDKPFVVGDFIVVGDKMGSVEYIGVRSTRIRALTGELLVFSNRDIVGSRIHNYREMNERRVNMKLSLGIATAADRIEEICEWAKKILSTESRIKVDHVNFIGFGSSSVDFEIFYVVKSSDNNLFLNLQQNFVVQLLAKLKKEGVDLAVPTERLRIERPVFTQESSVGRRTPEAQA